MASDPFCWDLLADVKQVWHLSVAEEDEAYQDH